MFRKIVSDNALIIITGLAIIAVTLIGLLFAGKKSEPVYLSKIDKLMFDKDNKSPKFVLSLPSWDKVLASAEENKSFEINDDVLQELNEEVELPKKKSMEDILAKIPNLGALPDTPQTQTLNNIMNSKGLIEPVNGLTLPKISPDNKKPWVEYGNVVDVLPNFKKVAIIIKGIGFDPLSLDKVSRALDSEVSFSFTPYAKDIGSKIIGTREKGHETYVDLLLSSKNFLQADSGPLSISLTISKEEALARLQRSLSTEAPIGGVVVNDGIADEDNREILIELLKELRNRGLLMIDATSGEGLSKIEVQGLPRKKADIVIDSDFRREAIDKALLKAEYIAFEKGQVLIVADPKPVVIVELFNWIKTFSPQVSYEEAKNMELNKPFALVPASNLVIQ
ncbi:MAG: divergent polysaccharide deacetylase family protein [Alphaproteobacteria bacterium]|nr:divergent polysaccharide deacetylase family protein [Alphaproteobacteria bacterium]